MQTDLPHNGAIDSEKRSFWKWLGDNKDQLTIILAIVGIPFISFQYFQAKLDTRIAKSNSYVAKQEEKEIVDAKTNLDLFIVSHDTLRAAYAQREYFDQNLWRLLHDEINKNSDSRTAYLRDFYKLHYFYADVSACTLNGECDAFSACFSFFPQIQFFRDNNNPIYTDINKTFDDNRANIIDRFVGKCDDRDYLFGLIDNSIWCRLWLYFRSFAMVDWFTVCRNTPVVPASSVEVLAGSLEEGEAAIGRSDFITAARLFRSQADQGNTAAQYALGALYELGLGVPHDSSQALIWFQKAADHDAEEGTMTQILGTIPQWISAIVAVLTLMVALIASQAWWKTLVAKRGDDLVVAAQDIAAAIGKLHSAVDRHVSRPSFGEHVSEVYASFRELRKAYAVAQRSYPNSLDDATLAELSDKVSEMTSAGEQVYVARPPNPALDSAFQQAARDALEKCDGFIAMLRRISASRAPTGSPFISWLGRTILREPES